MPDISNNESLNNNNVIQWSNSDNNAFYEALSAEGLQQFAEKSGIASCCDMQKLKPHWKNAYSILEVGAGYGRIINYLLANKFQGTITAIERCDSLFKHLEQQFNQYKNVRLFHQDILHLNKFDNKFDLILMLWSGIADFSSSEQAKIISQFAKFLNKKGKLVIDTIPSYITPLGAKKNNQQDYSIEINKFKVHIHLPKISDIKSYLKDTSLTNISFDHYKTDINRKRWLFILS